MLKVLFLAAGVLSLASCGQVADQVQSKVEDHIGAKTDEIMNRVSDTADEQIGKITGDDDKAASADDAQPDEQVVEGDGTDASQDTDIQDDQ